VSLRGAKQGVLNRNAFMGIEVAKAKDHPGHVVLGMVQGAFRNRRLLPRGCFWHERFPLPL